MHTISLSDGVVACVDEEMKCAVQPLKWRIVYLGGKRYVGATIGGRTVLLHRFVMGLSSSDPRMLDHKDRDTLNNLKGNLRFATRSQNMCNRTQQPHSKQPYKGIERLRSGKYRARITVDGKRRSLPGCFDTPEEAFECYKQAAHALHGEFACF